MDLVLKFLEHFAAITDALEGLGLWDETDGLYYHRLKTPAGTVVPVKVRSIVSMIPALAVGVVDQSMLERSLVVGKQFADFLGAHDPEGPGEKAAPRGAGRPAAAAQPGEPGPAEQAGRRERVPAPHGLRALSAYHRGHPYKLDIEGIRASIDYEPAESATPLFGGNSNWRGPVWFPVNYLVISVLESYYRFFGDDLTIEYPTGSGIQLTLDKAAADLQDRLTSIFTRGPDGGAPASARPSGCKTTGPGGTISSSASTPTVTTAPGSAPRTRPGGPA
jgi:hypothetical protein